MTYNKLVRDKIPSIIQQQGKQTKTRVATNSELIPLLSSKLMEESEEYIATSSVEELCDILEVLHALLNIHKMTFEELEIVRLEKRKTNGGFDNSIILIEVLEE
ncbi:MAG: phosphoribosyl-ATP pyrophosphohydrolase [Asgard group archaeon]|nr:phosphoribosyl-ATP pyrophosphohydrolase [Asgard group archaeon]